VAGPGRYGSVDTEVRTVPAVGGRTREVRHLRRRFPADPATVVPLARHRVVAGDRLDLLAARYYGDATASWRIAEANTALDPDALTGPDAVGTVLVIPVPES
jgi:nucleoid-associated protein YgaU